MKGKHFHIAWNEARSEGFITDDIADALQATKGVGGDFSSALGNAFAESYSDGECTVETVHIPNPKVSP